jgi:hypothetical protein
MQKSVLNLLFFAFGFLLLSCGGTDNPDPSPQKTAEQLAVEQLTGGSTITWAVANGGSVSKDGNPVTVDFSNFEFRLISTAASRSYTTTSNSLFDQSGSWSFVGPNFDKIQLTGSQPAAGREISFSRNGEKLTLTFNIPLPDARVTALAGSYVFELVKK